MRATGVAGVGIVMLILGRAQADRVRELQRIVLADVKPMEIGIRAVVPTRARVFIDVLRDRLYAAVDEGQLPDQAAGHLGC